MAISQQSASLVNVPGEQQAYSGPIEGSPNPSALQASEVASTTTTSALATNGASSTALDAYKELMEGSLRSYVAKSQALGGLVAEQVSSSLSALQVLTT